MAVSHRVVERADLRIDALSDALQRDARLGQLRQHRAITSAARPARRTRSSTAIIPTTRCSPPSWRSRRPTSRNISTWCSTTSRRRLPGDGGYHTAAYNAGRVTGALIRRVEPLLGRRAGAGIPDAAVPAHRPARLSAATPTRWRRSDAASATSSTCAESASALAAREVAGLCADSRKVEPRRRVLRARRRQGGWPRLRRAGGRRGAPASSSPSARRRRCPPASPFVGVADARAALSRAAARFYPRQPATIVAVTGTSGKTSVAAFVRQIWAKLGFEAASLGTIGVVSRPMNVYGSLTTPDPIALHQTLDELARRRRHPSGAGGLLARARPEAARRRAARPPAPSPICRATTSTITRRRGLSRRQAAPVRANCCRWARRR